MPSRCTAVCAWRGLQVGSTAQHSTGWVEPAQLAPSCGCSCAVWYPTGGCVALYVLARALAMAAAGKHGAERHMACMLATGAQVAVTAVTNAGARGGRCSWQLPRAVHMHTVK